MPKGDLSFARDIRKRPGRPRKKKLTDKQLTYAQTLIETGSIKEAKAVAGYPPTLATSKFMTPEMQKHIDRLVEQVNYELKELAPMALSNIVNLANNSKNEKIQLTASKDLLDRAGFKPVERKEIAGANGAPIEARITHELVQRYLAMNDEEGD